MTSHKNEHNVIVNSLIIVTGVRREN